MNTSHVILFDPSIATKNAGDEIIMDAVKSELSLLLNSKFIINLPTQDYIGSIGRKLVKKADFCIVGGTNLLTSNYRTYRQWKITPWDALLMRGKVVLMGVGWWQYQKYPDPITRLLYRNILAKEKHILHSVRDEYTRKMLMSMGIANVVNTSCPSMWSFDVEHCSQIPKKRGYKAILTLTDYNKNINADRSLYQLLLKYYAEVVAWPQGDSDYNYFKELGISNIISHGLVTLDKLLLQPDIDYVGTRLHAGIRALQHKRRSLILAVDNRASEISKDTGMWVIAREDIGSIEAALSTEKSTEINIPTEKIHSWRESTVSLNSKSARISKGDN